MRGVLDVSLGDKICQWPASGGLFSGTTGSLHQLSWFLYNCGNRL